MARIFRPMRVFLLLYLLFWSGFGLNIVFGQVDYDFKFIDNYVEKTPKYLKTDLTQLAKYLVASSQNELEEVRAIYQWILLNIDYDSKAYKNGNKRLNRNNQDVLNRGKAVCWGYANLFHTMMKEVGIESQVISGYARTELAGALNLDAPNHAWNAVEINEKWYLLDVTWDSGLQNGEDIFQQTYKRDYFLTTPEYFILNHIPANPIWQLLDCPLSLKEAEKASFMIVQENVQNCDSLHYSVDEFMAMQAEEKRLQEAIATYDFHPSEQNKRHLGSAFIDYQYYLDEQLVKLQESDQLDSFLVLQKSMIEYCEQASKMMDLLDNQKENCAYNYLNYAIELSRMKKELPSDYQGVMLDYIIRAEEMLKPLKRNFFVDQALKRCEILREQVR